jgi:hypothetical protein
MPSRNWQLRVQDILRAIADIHYFTNGKQFTAACRPLCLACEQCFLLKTIKLEQTDNEKPLTNGKRLFIVMP